MNSKTVLLTAGGTGGHLFPAFALGEELVRRGFEIDLITDPRGDRFRSEFSGRHIYHVPSATLKSKSPVAIAKTLKMLGKGVSESNKLINEILPSAVIGFGGYPTFPPLVAATFKRIPTAVHEANAVMGRANRMIAPFVDAIATSFTHTKRISRGMSKKVHVTGNPVRDAVKMWSSRPYHGPLLGHRIVLVVFGGSQGARVFSDIVPEALKRLSDDICEGLIVIQQCREEDLVRVRSVYEEAGIEAEVEPFFSNLPERLAAAHLVIARSGASTVSELALMGRPSILVPLPHSLDNDQLFNAEQLQEAGGAICLKQQEFTPERLAQEVESLLRDSKRLEHASKSARAMGTPDAVVHLADLVEELCKKNRASGLKK